MTTPSPPSDAPRGDGRAVDPARACAERSAVGSVQASTAPTPASPAGAMKPVRIALAISSVFVRAANFAFSFWTWKRTVDSRDEQAVADLVVGEALGGELEHALLLRGRRDAGHPVGDQRVQLLDDLRSGGRARGASPPSTTRSIAASSSGSPAALVT